MRRSKLAQPSAACILALLVFTLSLPGCATRAYRYSRLDRDDLIAPPHAATVPAGKPAVIFLKHARAGAHGPQSCDFATQDFTLTWRGPAARISVQRESLALGAGPENAPPPAFRQFEIELSKLEENGCIARGAAARLAGSVIEHLPLSSLSGYYLRYGYYRTGYIDLRADFRLKIISPIMRNGATALDAVSILGWETAYYNIEPRPRTGGIQLVLASVEATVDGKVTAKTVPNYGRIDPPRNAGVYRLFFLAASGRRRRNITLVGEGSAASLDAITGGVGPGEQDLCDQIPRPAFCVRFPVGIAVSPELRIEAQARATYVPLGATVGELLANLPDKSPVLADLRVTRIFEGKAVRIDFDRKTDDILQLVLIAGDQIRW